MTNYPPLEDFLKTHADKFETKTSWIVFKNLHYRASGEKVIEGFRYFRAPIDELVAAFSAQDFQKIGQLPFAFDDEGDVDTSSVLLDLAYTDSGAFLAAQPVEYQDHNPTPVAAPLLLEGETARALIAQIKELDQSN